MHATVRHYRNAPGLIDGLIDGLIGHEEEIRGLLQEIDGSVPTIS